MERVVPGARALRRALTCARPLSLSIALLLACGAFAPGCGGPGRARSRGPTLEQRVGTEAWARLLLVRESLRANELDSARAELESVCRLVPDEVEPALLLQEVELRLIEAGAWIEPAREAAESAAAESAAAPPRTPQDALRRYVELEQQRAAEAPSFVALLRAARVTSDPEQAEARLAAADELQPDNAWVPYARAHRLWTSGSEQRRARQSLQRALELDPGLLPALRLSAALQAREGRAADALEALDLWLEPAREDPCVWPADLRNADLDRGALLVLAGEARDAEKLLEGLVELSAAERARRDLLLAAAHEARDQPVEALRAAQAAALNPAGELLALQQQALLYELWLQDYATARTAWERVLAAASGAPSVPAAEPGARAASDGGAALQSLLLRVQARAHIERVDRELARRRDAARAGT